MASKGKRKARARTKGAAKDLTAKHAGTVKGGRKAGGSQQEYLIVKMNDVLITG